MRVSTLTSASAIDGKSPAHPQSTAKVHPHTHQKESTQIKHVRTFMCGDGRRPCVRASVGMPIDKVYSEPRPDEASANNILTKLMDVTTRRDFCKRVLAHLHVSACATIVRINKWCDNTTYCICMLTCRPRFPMFTGFDIDERASDFVRPYGCRR